MKITLDNLTEAELIELNHRLVARLRFLREMLGGTQHSSLGECKVQRQPGSSSKLAQEFMII
jgi:hypothetical protein